MKPLILFGLGNPGDEYRNTRHNMGENAVRAWAAKAGLKFESGDGPYLQTPVRRGVRAVIPTTYMNLAGKAVTKLKAQLVFDAREFLVVADDVWLSLGHDEPSGIMMSHRVSDPQEGQEDGFLTRGLAEIRQAIEDRRLELERQKRKPGLAKPT